MNFRTELNVNNQLELPMNSKFYSIGSCFANMIGGKLSSFKFQVLENPFGILYNPISIANTLTNNQTYKNLFCERDEVIYNYAFHSEIKGKSQIDLDSKIISISNNSNQKFNSSNVIIITFGTAHIYELISKNEIVANCHKAPSNQFRKRLLSVKEIKSSYDELIQKHSDKKFIFTVSPVRHIKDGIKENSVSKSILRLACNELEMTYENVSYFPSYELMMDDLRDYRFYKGDLLHPTEFAENYIWGKFIESTFDKNSSRFIEKWSKIKSKLNHKPFNTESTQHQKFLQSLLIELEGISEVDCKEEIESVKKLIS